MHVILYHYQPYQSLHLKQNFFFQTNPYIISHHVNVLLRPKWLAILVELFSSLLNSHRFILLTIILILQYQFYQQYSIMQYPKQETIWHQMFPISLILPVDILHTFIKYNFVILHWVPSQVWKMCYKSLTIYVIYQGINLMS